MTRDEDNEDNEYAWSYHNSTSLGGDTMRPSLSSSQTAVAIDVNGNHPSHSIPLMGQEVLEQGGLDDDMNSRQKLSHYNSTTTMTMTKTKTKTTTDVRTLKSNDDSPIIIMNERGEDGADHIETSSLSSSTWQFTDFGRIPERSRDGSIHATDEVVNAATHLAATLLSILGTVLLIVESSAMGAPWKIVSFTFYGISLIGLFACSTLHHSVTSSRPGVEDFFRMLDYMAIFPLIAGTFTPLCLVPYHRSVIGWTFAGVVWFLSIVGMILTANLFHKLPKWLSMTMYMTIGWIGACMTYWLIPVLGYEGFFYFLLGGIFYTVGGYIYSTECLGILIEGRIGFHEVWHVLVMLGAASHYWLMYSIVLPYEPNTTTRTENDENHSL